MWTIGIGRGREILDPGKVNGAIGNAKAVREPEERNGTKNNQSVKMHGNWYQRCPQVMLTRDAKQPGPYRGWERRTSAGSPLARTGMEHWRGSYAQRGQRAPGRPVYWGREALRGNDAASPRVACDPDRNTR